jgi:hypothetical protein
MLIKIIVPNGDLKREVWEFTLSVTYRVNLRFVCYAFEERETLRHRIWKTQSLWGTYFERASNIARPTVPLNVIEQAKERYCRLINEAEVI